MTTCSPIPKVKKLPKKPSKGTCDGLFSKWVRSRDGACVRCGTTERLQCAHIISRRYHAIRWDEDNAMTLCASCHMYFTYRPVEWQAYVAEVCGPNHWHVLSQRAMAVTKPDYDAVARKYGGRGTPVGGETKIEYLQAGDPVPDGEPRRYISDAGYVRLRWKVSPRRYIEAWEHRVVSGAPEGLEVHHINGDKTDNRPENLALLPKAEHASLTCDPKKIDLDVVRPLYEAGLTTADIARRTGWNGAAIYRKLRAAGVQMRTGREVQRSHVNEDEIERLARSGVRAARIAKTLGCSAALVRRVFDERGIPPFPPGRPTKP